MFHPFEVAVCGGPGSGKSTLITRLIAHLAADYRIGYARHGGAAADCARKGSDPKPSRSAGAARVLVTDNHATTLTASAPIDFVQGRTAFEDCDCVLAEGWGQRSLPCIVMLDADGSIPGEPAGDQAGPVLAWVGAPAARPEGLRLDAPYIQRDDIAGLAAVVARHLGQCAARAPLHGLVLAGGRSTRMQRDKALLEYGGRTQVERTVELLTPFCGEVFVSARRDQWDDPRLVRLPQIHDSILNFGPSGGILSAMQARRDAAWLVVACDLPLLEAETLADLVRQRAPLRVATAYTSAHDGFPEPLCAIYEPRARCRLFEFLAVGYDCPRKMLINSYVRLLDLRNRRALENVNHPDEYERARRDIERPEAGRTGHD